MRIDQAAKLSEAVGAEAPGEVHHSRNTRRGDASAAENVPTPVPADRHAGVWVGVGRDVRYAAAAPGISNSALIRRFTLVNAVAAATAAPARFTYKDVTAVRVDRCAAHGD